MAFADFYSDITEGRAGKGWEHPTPVSRIQHPIAYVWLYILKDTVIFKKVSFLVKRLGFKFQLCYCLLLRPTLLPPPIALKMRSWMQVVNLGDNPKTHQLGRSSKGRQRYKVSYPAVSITGSELQSCSWPEAREPRDMSTNTIPSSAEGINSLALQLVLCALWGWGWGVALR